MANREIHVLVVGGSWAGVTAVNELLGLSHVAYSRLHVTLVEQRTHYFHRTGVIRGLVDQKYADKMFIPYQRLFMDGNKPSPHHRLVCAKLTHIYEHSIEVEGGERIFYDYLIIATGAAYTSLPVTQSIDEKECREKYQKMRNAIEAARSILFVGGGAVGVGMCCEIAEMHPKKLLMLAHARDRLLNEDLSDNFSNTAEVHMKKMGIDLILGETVLSASIHDDDDDHSTLTHDEWVVKPQIVHTKSGRRIPCDLVIWTTGARPITDFMNSLLPSNEKHPLVDVNSGQINVRPTLQLADLRYPYIFAVGDVNSLPFTEKYAPNAVLQAKHAVSNLRELMNESYDYRIKVSPTMAAEATASAQLAPYVGTRNTQVVVALGKSNEISSTILAKLSNWAGGSHRGRKYLLDKAEKMLNV
ncbi:hypothetical protein H4S02_008176 [Coemansia sp. RSA 2611]|nr:hypothetical protein LPJ60_005077 [Coemansia sp. RSA 2675]KAJ2375598.1 hypothetical protein H4S02_008176 [Coemansia sp. RSA 2611]KAJ2416964.1 hypothetical protein GGI10_000565 [Coemansia sp. RSA 2530]